MGRKIVLEKESYEQLLKEITGIHQNVLDVVDEYLKELDDLLIEEGGFHADLISEKVKLILELFKEQVLVARKKEYQETEERLIQYGKRIMEIDQSGEGKAVWHESI